MSVSFFIFAIMLSLASAQECGENGNESNHSEINNCIKKYRDLESYILSNKDLMDNLTQNFFENRKISSEFVRITYKFQILLPIDNSNNDTNIIYGNGDDKYACIDRDRDFIWSSSALYLLGPEPLFWQTLLSINIHISKITIHLPCLCNDNYDYLLSRLTYLVSVKCTYI